MKLYHYNVAKLSEVKSLLAQGKREDNTDPYYYGKSISWFLEPVPTDLPSILGGQHKYWKYGVKLYEHVIDINDLPKDVVYRIVESYPRKALIDKQDWSKVGNDRGTTRAKLIKELDDLDIGLGYKGKGLVNLKKAIRTLDYDIRKDYENLYKEWLETKDDGLMTRYASGVPHLMLYVGHTSLPVRSVTLRVLGGKSVSTEKYASLRL